MPIFDNYPVLHEVMINLKTDVVFRGVVYKQKKNYIVLKNAELLRSKERPLPVDGEILIDKSNIDFIQVVK